MDEKLFDMAGNVAVVTGSSKNGGIGYAIATAFAEHGADVVVTDIDDAGARAASEEIKAMGRKTAVFHCDISKPEEVEKLFAEVDKVFPAIHILVNVPFAFPSRVRPHELTLEAWNKTLAVSLTGYFLCAQQALRRFLRQGTGGCILNIGSIAGMSALGRGNFPYSCAKGAVTQMTRELSLEYAQDGIRVNAIIPAQVSTPGLKKQLATEPEFAKSVNRFMAGIPMGRLLEPEDFKGPAVFLCSNASSGVTGVLLPVDGGNLAMNAGGSAVWPKD